MAVYTHVDNEALRAFLAAYDLGALKRHVPIAEGVENSNYALATDRGRFILTIYERRVDPADLPFFLGLMEHLAGRHLPCPSPVRARNGAVLQRLAGKPAAIVSFLEGRSIRRIDPAHCQALGEALGALHLASRDFALTRPNALGLEGWRQLFAACGARAAEVEPGLDVEMAAELDALATAWPEDLPRGVIHADLFPDNVFFASERVSGVIDFYFACNDLMAYDIAICLNAWCFEADFSFNVTKSRALLEGYLAQRQLEPMEMLALPVLARGAALRFLMTRLYDWLHRVEGAIVQPKDPREYLRKLRFHRSIKSPAAYGLG